MKIAFISAHPAPYRNPLFSRLCNDPRLYCDVYDEREIDQGHGFWALGEQGYLSRQLYPYDSGVFIRIAQLMRNLVFGDYDLVIWSGFYSNYQVLAMLLSLCFHRRYGFAADTVEQKSIGMLSKVLKRAIVRHARLIFVPGEAGKKFWREKYGVAEARIVKGAYALDNKKLDRDILSLQKKRLEIRRKLGLKGDDKVFLMVANMIPSRHYPITANGFISFAEQHRDCRFIIVGNGPEFEKMKKTSNEHSELVVLPGCAFAEMMSLYAAADVYVHGGKEPASTALVIGAIAGLPIVTSDAVGCSKDVLMDGSNGVKVKDYLSSDCWRHAFEEVYGQADKWREYGECSKRLASSLDVDAVHEEFVRRLFSVV